MTLTLVTLILAAQAATPAASPTATLERLIACREVATRDARLACFDREAGAVATARDNRDLVVLDRAEAEAARAPRSPRAEFEPVSATLTAATQDLRGRGMFTLSDGSRWTQADTRRVSQTPRAGNSIRIRPAALGSYFANVEDGIAIRVRPAD